MSDELRDKLAGVVRGHSGGAFTASVYDTVDRILAVIDEHERGGGKASE